MKDGRATDGAASDRPTSLTSLGAALDGLFARDAPDTADALSRLTQFVFDLIGAKRIAVYGAGPEMAVIHAIGTGGSDDFERELATRALREDRVVARPPTMLAAPTSTGGGACVFVATLPPGNPALAALAYERLELLRALCRARFGGGREAAPSALLENAAAVASGDWGRAQAFAEQIALATSGGCSLLRLPSGGGVRVVASGQQPPSRRSPLTAKLQRRAKEAVRRASPVADELLLGGERPTHLLVLDGGDLPGHITQPVAAIFSVASMRRPWLARYSGALNAAAAAAAIAALGFVPIGDGVNLPAETAAVTTRMITAPFDGRISAVLVEDGDSVRADETVLVRMDVAQLEIAAAKARSELTAAITRRDSLQGRRNAADFREADLEAKHAELEIALIERRLGLAEIKAPIAGVVRGEGLSARDGSFIGLGGELMEIVDPSALMMMVFISPRARGRIDQAQSVVFRADAAPDRPHNLEIASIAIAPTSPGPNPVYLARSAPLADPGGLRPGMQGVARFVFDDAPLGLILWRRLRDWALLTFWL